MGLKENTVITLFGAQDDWSVTGKFKGEVAEFGQNWIEIEPELEPGKIYCYSMFHILAFRIKEKSQ